MRAGRRDRGQGLGAGPRRRRHRPDHPQAVPQAGRADRLRRVPLLRLDPRRRDRAGAEPDPGHRPQLRLRLLARARPLGAARTSASRRSSPPPSPTSSTSNCTKIGLLPVILDEEHCRRRRRGRRGADRPRRPDRQLRRPASSEFEIEPDVKHRLLNGLDDIGITLENAAAIDAFEDSGARRPRPGHDRALSRWRTVEHRPARVGRRDLRPGLRPAVRAGAMEVLERLELSGDETVLDAGCGSRPGHRAADRAPARGQRDRRRRLGGDDREGARERSATRHELPGRRPRRARARPSRSTSSSPPPPSTGSPTTTPLRAPARGAAAGRAAGRPVRGRGQHRRAAPRRSRAVAARARVRAALRGHGGSSGTSRRPRRPRRGCAPPASTDVRCWLRAEAGDAPPTRSSSSTTVTLGPHLARLPEELRDPFADAVLDARGRAADPRLRAPQHRGARRRRAVESRRADDAPRIVLLPGDGIGPEIVGAARAPARGARRVRVRRAPGRRRLDRRARHRAHRRGARGLPRAPTRSCSAPSAGRSGTRPTPTRRAPSRACSACARGWASTPTCARCGRARRWSAPARCARSGSRAPTCSSSAS